MALTSGFRLPLTVRTIISVKFTKMQGLGNDYVFVSTFEQPIDNPKALARAVSDRHHGIGSDGLILISPSVSADVRMEMYNADGSRAEMCGNGIRCVAKFAVDRGLAAGPEVRIETDAGERHAECESVNGSIQSVRVDMGQPLLSPEQIPSTLPGDRIVDTLLRLPGHLGERVGGQDFRVTCVSMGNPHAVMFVDDLDSFPVGVIGPAIENASVFPRRINAHFVQIDSPSHLFIRTWERGSGETRACGTGACAVVVAGVLTGRSDRLATVTLPGGDLAVNWNEEDNHVYMTGPAVEVFNGSWCGINV